MSATLTFVKGNTYQLSYKNLKSIEIDNYDRKDASFPSYGVISNGGKITIVDYDGTLKKLAKQNILKGKSTIEVYLKETKSLNSVFVCRMECRNWSYDAESKIATAELTDGLERMQDVDIQPVLAVANDENYQTANTVYSYLVSQSKLNGFSDFKMLSSTDLLNLSRYKIAHYYIDKKCLCQLK